MIRIGDIIRIIHMMDEPSYSGKTGIVKSIDDIGQLHGTWGGLAIQPENDDFQVICCICGKAITGYGNNPSPVKEDGSCCDKCNAEYVILSRLLNIKKGEN